VGDALNARGSQLNSKLFKGVELGPSPPVTIQSAQFDLAIATRFSYYLITGAMLWLRSSGC